MTLHAQAFRRNRTCNFELACTKYDKDKVYETINALPERLELCNKVKGGRFEKYKSKLRK